MQPSPWLYAFLKQYERFRPTAYKPTPKDKWTAGWGHTRGVTETTVCSMAEGDVWLVDDVEIAVSEIERHIHVPLNQSQFDALCSLVFNCGPAPLLDTLGHKLNAGDYAGAAAEFIRWDKQAGVELEGLDNRRKAERARFELPVAEPLVA